MILEIQHINNFIFAITGVIGLLITIGFIIYITYKDQTIDINKQFYKEVLKSQVKISKKKIKCLIKNYSRN